VPLTQDPDVLDTWFSSWLWPLTTMGWKGEELPNLPVETKRLIDYYLPTDLLVTGPDIIFFWVARMIMSTLKFGETVPFTDVYFTSIIRDGKGRKLSKSLGNSPDPLDVMDKYGADAVRFTMTYLSPLGQDVRLEVDEATQDVPSMELGRNFANKVWNAGRFLQMKAAELGDVEITASLDALAEAERTEADRWILSRCASTIEAVDKALGDHRITEYARVLYDAIWRDFCDWYIEDVKIRCASDADAASKARVLGFAYAIYERFLALLHPVMPFITEELWHGLTGADATSFIGIGNRLDVPTGAVDNEVEHRFAVLQDVVESIRRQRNELMIPPSERVPVAIDALPEYVALLNSQSHLVRGLGRCSQVTVAEGLPKPPGSIVDVVRGMDVYMIVQGMVDLGKERLRLEKELVRLRGQIVALDKKLSNERFVQGAPADVVEAERKKRSDWASTIEKLERNVAALAEGA